MNIRSICCWALALIATGPGGLAAQDTIFKTSGAPLVGVTIDGESWEEVTYTKAGGGRGKIISEEVAEVLRGGAPGALVQGRNAHLGGDGKIAVRLLEQARTEAGDRDWVKEAASFWLGEAHSAAGDAQAASSAYRAVLSANAKSRRMLEVQLGMARAMASAKDFSGAERALKAFAQQVRSEKMPERFGFAADAELARLLSAQGRHAQAASAFGSVASEAKSAASKLEGAQQERLMSDAMRAKFQQGRAQVEAGLASQASSTFRSLASGFGSTPGAESYSQVGLAQVAIAGGKADEARVSLARVLSIQLGADDVRPFAMLTLARAYLALAEKNETDARAKARVYLDLLVKRHAGSAVGAAARDLLRSL